MSLVIQVVDLCLFNVFLMAHSLVNMSKTNLNIHGINSPMLFLETPPGANGNYMLPFFSPEISPLYQGNDPLLKGNSNFENWRSPKLAIQHALKVNL